MKADGLQSVGHRVGNEVLRLIQDEPYLCPSDILFLAHRHDDGLHAVAVLEAAGVEVQHIFAEGEPGKFSRKQQFYADSPGVEVCSLKGWESRAVVLSVSGSGRSHQLAYVALTRVKGHASHRSAFVTVVNHDRSLTKYGAFFVAV